MSFVEFEVGFIKNNYSLGPSGLDRFFVTNSSINHFLRYPLSLNESVNHILTFGRSVPKNSLRFNTSLVSLRSSKMVTQPPLVFFIFLVTKWKFTTSLLRNNWRSCCCLLKPFKTRNTDKHQRWSHNKWRNESWNHCCCEQRAKRPSLLLQNQPGR